MPIVSFRVRLCDRQDSLWSPEGGHRGIVIVFCGEKWGAIQTVRCESEGYNGEEVEGLAAKAFGSDFALVHPDELADRNP